MLFAAALRSPAIACVADFECFSFAQCFVNQRCLNGNCVSDPRNCNTGDACNPGHCDNTLGCVVDHLFAADNLICNGFEYCFVVPLPVGGGIIFIPMPGVIPFAGCNDDNACTE